MQLCAMSIGDRIARARKDKRLSQAELGEAVNVGQTTVSSWERGRTEPTRDDVARIAAALGIPVGSLELPTADTTDWNQAAPVRTVPIVGYVGAGAAAHFYTSDHELGRIEAPEDATSHTVASEIKGDSAGPWFNGWVIFYDDVRSPITPDLIGEVCIVGLSNGKVLMKEIQHARSPGRYDLISQFEETLPNQEVVWAALVRGMRRK